MTALGQLGFERDARLFCSDFTDPRGRRRYVLGRGEYAQSVADHFDLDGVVDDFADSRRWRGLDVVRTDDLPDDCMVVVASMLRVRTALTALRSRGIRCLDYYAFERFCAAPIRPVSFWPEFRESYTRDRHRLDRVRSRLNEPESQDIFDKIVDFRLTGDTATMESFSYDPVNQYFEPFLELQDTGETFIDVGSFDGATSLEFARRAPGFREILAFEPDPDNYRTVCARLAQFAPNRVRTFNQGLSDATRTVAFEPGGGSTSRIHTTATGSAEVVALDALGLQSATFIKMDIEGAEEAAIRGAIDTIARLRPRLAISVYHKADDLWRIPATVDLAGVPFELRIRHYTEGMDETVMFFLPTAEKPWGDE